MDRCATHHGYKVSFIMKKNNFVLSLFFFSISFIPAQDDKAAAIEEATGLDIKQIGLMSIDQLNIAIRIDPSNVEAYFQLGYYYFYDEKNYEKAILNYTKAIELNPDDLNTYFERGRVYYEIDNNIAAIKDFETALKNGGDYYHYRFLAYAYQKIGDSENAAKYHGTADILEDWRKEEMESK
jgi:tetratricopeptide (TPR) repeat protein